MKVVTAHAWSLILCTCSIALLLPPPALADFTGLQTVERTDLPICQDPSEPEIPYKLDVCNVYAVFNDPADRLISVGFTSASTTDPNGFFQHSFGSDTSPGCNLISPFPALVCDSYVTVANECDDGTDDSATDPDWNSPLFNTAGQIAGGWYNMDPSNGQGVPDANGRVLIAQFSVKQNRDVTGALSVFATIGGAEDATEFPLQAFDCFAESGGGGGGGSPIPEGEGEPLGGDPDPACGPDAGNCYTANNTPGCDCIPCCEAVCAVDPLCCDDVWDSLCAITAGGGPLDLCPDGNNDGTPDSCQVCPGEGNCCTANGTPGCSDGNCCDIVCGIDSSCCDVEWTQACANLANKECHSFLDCCCTRAGGFCRGDLDGSEEVGPFDLALLLGSWGPDPGNPCADLDDNGQVGPFDLALLLGYWGPCDCFSPCTATPELFCDDDYRGVLDDLVPMLHELLCIALDEIGQFERCPPNPLDSFYVEMYFSLPTLTYELPDGGPSIGLRIDFVNQEVTVLIAGQPVHTFLVPFPQRFRNAALQDAVVAGQTAWKFIKALITLSDPCVLREMLDLMGDIYGEPFWFGVPACIEFICFTADLLVNNEYYEDLLVVFAIFKCGAIWTDLHDLYTPAQIDAIEFTLNQWRDWLCVQPGVCPCDVLPCSP